MMECPKTAILATIYLNYTVLDRENQYRFKIIFIDKSYGLKKRKSPV